MKIAWMTTMPQFRIGRIVILAVAFAAGAAASARADGFVNPFIGYHFGGNSACVSVMLVEPTMGSSTFAIPKSNSLGIPSFVVRILFGLISRWTTRF